MTTRSVKVQLGKRTYPIEIGFGTLKSGFHRHKVVEQTRGKIFIVADPKVRRFIRPVLQKLKSRIARVVWMKAGETAKNIHTLNELYAQAARAKLDRQALVVAVGGGVIGDVTGFFAASYLRGLSFIQIPTTVMAQVDSSIGGKTGINLPSGKNLVGAFHQPSLVFIDADTLETLPEREFCSGLAEVIKYGVIADRQLFDRLENNASRILDRNPKELAWILQRCCAIKANVVSRDEHETRGLRATLNFGHTIGHGIEAAANYRLLHGEAIAIGMVGATLLSQQITSLDKKSAKRIQDLIQRLKLPTTLPKGLSISRIIQAMKLDKKASQGQMKFVLANRIGYVKTGIPVSEDQVIKVLKALK